jgi:threonine synthase
MMGLPIRHLVVATNENDVLDEFFHTGKYQPRNSKNTFQTSSPSMDISKASNFERFIFDLIGRDASILRDYWKQIDSGGSFQIDKETMKKVLAFGFISSSSKHENRIKLIKQFYEDFDVIIDTHTADGVKASLDHFSGDIPMLVLETALPIKFEKSVLEAIGKKPARPEALVNLEEIDQRFKIFENKASLVKDFILEKK